MANYLVTGYRGEPHVTAAQEGLESAGIFGTESYVLNVNNNLKVETSGTNAVKVNTGAMIMQGRLIAVEEAETLTIESASSGKYRADLVVMTYEIDSKTGVETAYLEVLQGEEVSSNPQTPDITEGDIFSGATKNQFKIARIGISNVNALTVSNLFNVASSLATLQKGISAANTSISTLSTAVNTTKPANWSGDMDALTTAGRYFISNTDFTPKNWPDIIAGFVDVLVYGSRIKQIVYRNGDTDAAASKIFVRNYSVNNSAWTNWVEMISAESVPQVRTGSVSFGTIGSGTSSSKTVEFDEMRAVPTVIAQSNKASLDCYVSTVKEGGIVIVAVNNGSSSMSNVTVNYIAIA
jgi:hypothetical protein